MLDDTGWTGREVDPLRTLDRDAGLACECGIEQGLADPCVQNQVGLAPVDAGGHRGRTGPFEPPDLRLFSSESIGPACGERTNLVGHAGPAEPPVDLSGLGEPIAAP